MIVMLINWLFDYFIILGTIIIATLLYYYSTSTYDKWRKLNVPHIPPLPFFGNFLNFALAREHQAYTFDRVYRQFPNEKICGFYQMRTPYLMIRDPELINRIMISDFSYFTDHGFELDESTNVIGRSLFFMNGQKWRTMRQKLSPGFTSGKIKGTYNQITECSEELINCITNKIKKTKQIEVHEITRNFTTDVIGTCAFGLKLDTIKESDSDFRNHTKKLFEVSYRLMIINILLIMSPKFLKFFKIQAISPETSEFFQSVFNDAFKYREENNISRNDVMQTLIQAKKDLVLNNNSNNEHKFVDLDIIGNALLMFTGGSEPISIIISYCLYELSLNKDIQDKLRAEINLKNKKYDGQFTNEYLSELHYADMVLNETLRKYSILTFIIREATQTYSVPGESFIIEKGQQIVIPMYSVHRDSKYYPKPDVFDPERFTPEEKSKRPSGTFFPFGDGPRICIGKRFAETEMKLALSKILSKFEVLPCEKTDVPLEMKVGAEFLTPKNGIWLSFKPIMN